MWMASNPSGPAPGEPAGLLWDDSVHCTSGPATGAIGDSHPGKPGHAKPSRSKSTALPTAARRRGTLE